MHVESVRTGLLESIVAQFLGQNRHSDYLRYVFATAVVGQHSRVMVHCYPLTS